MKRPFEIIKIRLKQIKNVKINHKSSIVIYLDIAIQILNLLNIFIPAMSGE